MSSGNIGLGTLALFRDASSTHLVIRDIQNAFEGAGFPHTLESEATSRKPVFNSYINSLDLADESVQRRLRRALAQLLDVIAVRSAQASIPLINALKRDGLTWHDGALDAQAPAPGATTTAPTYNAAPSSSSPTIVANEIEELLRAVPRALRELQPEHRHDHRTDTMPMEDEFDLQDLLRSYLIMRYPVLSDEEWTPKLGDRAGRVDFALRGEKVFLEVKFVRDRNHWDTKVEPSIYKKIEVYSRDADCDVLLIFIYDPTLCLREAAKLERDFSGERGDVRKRWILRTVIAPSL